MQGVFSTSQGLTSLRQGWQATVSLDSVKMLVPSP